MSVPDVDGFIYVSYKKKKKPKSVSEASGKHERSFRYLCNNRLSTPCFSALSPTKIQFLKKDLENSNFFHEFKSTLSCILERLKSVQKENELDKMMNTLLISDKDETVDIVCYGLGSFSSCLIARYQLVFLLALKDYLNATNVSIYDPIFSEEENACLTELGLNVLLTNEKAKRVVKRKTIFFMPHCDLPLYNNLLWSNWNINNISKLIIIGNSFSFYEQLPNCDSVKRGNYLSLAMKFVSEVKVLNDFIYLDVFNDMSIHCFENKFLCKVPTEVWMKTEEPVYSQVDSLNYS